MIQNCLREMYKSLRLLLFASLWPFRQQVTEKALEYDEKVTSLMDLAYAGNKFDLVNHTSNVFSKASAVDVLKHLAKSAENASAYMRAKTELSTAFIVRIALHAHT